jgi:transposase
LYEIDANEFINIVGQSMAKAVRYQLQRLRCARCGLVVRAEMPQGMPQEKYDSRFKAILAVQKYFGGVPFYRQQQLQALQNIPLPDATQWELVEQVADCVYPIIGELEHLAAQGELVHNDDTSVKIIEVMQANKSDPKRERTGMFTTGIIAKAVCGEIALYYSGKQHAGENLSAILKKRSDQLPPIQHMCDALKANLTPAFKTILFHCLAHGRRKFTDIEAFFPQECAYVIEKLGQVYGHDAQTKKQGLNAKDRLLYHQKHSVLIMQELKSWLDRQFDEALVEPNGGLGKAIQYLLNHWEELTKFLHVAGGPLDNNIVEQALKIPIRLRKNSLIHRTCHGASIASILMSIIATCRLNGVNPIDYLIACQENRSLVRQQTKQWLPWTYQERGRQAMAA